MSLKVLSHDEMDLAEIGGFLDIQKESCAEILTKFIQYAILHIRVFNRFRATSYCCRNLGTQLTKAQPEAEFLDVIGTKVLRVFLLAIHGHLYCEF